MSLDGLIARFFAESLLPTGQMIFSTRKSFNNGELPGNTAPRGARLSERRERPGRPSDESAPAARGEAWLLGVLYRYLRTVPIITCGNVETTLRNR